MADAQGAQPYAGCLTRYVGLPRGARSLTANLQPSKISPVDERLAVAYLPLIPARLAELLEERAMEYRRLGSSGVLVSAVGLGGNTFGRECDARATTAIVHQALDLGVNHFDCADI